MVRRLDDKKTDCDASGKISERRTDELAAEYSLLASDDKESPKLREACMLFCIVEHHIDDDEDYDEASRIAAEALDIFQALDIKKGMADTSRLLVHALLGKSETLAWTEPGDCRTNAAGQILKEAQAFADQTLQTFQRHQYEIGVACMRLSQAELIVARSDDTMEIAIIRAKEALSTFQEYGLRKMEGITLKLMAQIYARLWKMNEVYKHCDSALKIFRRLNDRLLMGRTQHMLASIKHTNNKHRDAQATAREALKAFRIIGIKKLVALSCLCLADWYLRFCDKTREAMLLGKESLALFQELGYGKGWQAGAQDIVIQAMMRRGDKDQAIHLAEASVERFRQNDDRRSVIYMYQSLSQGLLSQNSHDEALNAQFEAVELSRSIDDRRLESQCLHQLAQMYVQLRDFADAENTLREACNAARVADDRRQQARVLDTWMHMHLVRNDGPNAYALARQLRMIYSEVDDRNAEAFVCINLASACGMLSKTEECAMYADEADAIFAEIGNKRGQGHAQRCMCEINLSQVQYELALSHAHKMQADYAECEDLKLHAEGMRQLLQVHLAQNDLDAGIECATKMCSLARRSGNRCVEADMLITFVDVQIRKLQDIGKKASDNSPIQSQHIDQVLRPAKDGVMLASKSGDRLQLAHNQHCLGTAFSVCGKFADALRCADAAIRLFVESEAKPGVVSARLLRATALKHSNEKQAAKTEAELALEIATSAEDVDGMKRADELLASMVEKVQAVPVAQTSVAAAIADDATEQQEANLVEAPVVALPKGLEIDVVQAIVKEVLTSSLGSDEDVENDTPLMEAGLDSLSMVAFRNMLQKETNVMMPASVMFDYPTMASLVDHLVESSKG